VRLSEFLPLETLKLETRKNWDGRSVPALSIKGSRVGVNAKSGVVRLTGNVNRASLKSPILSTATKTPSVKAAVNDLMVRR
jgi:osmotically-inducible protein OsmY